MSAKIGRNDPCPCGSGRKYKHCCGGVAPADEPDHGRHAGAVERALDWLASGHRKAVGLAIEAMLFEGLSDDECVVLEAAGDEAWKNIQLNANEWLLAEGEILVRGQRIRVSDLLLGPGGPLFTAGQRQWLAQLSERPLRLYQVTEVIPGRQMTLCDALDVEALPIIINEGLGSEESLIGMLLGCRIMAVDDHFELSGAVYAFALLAKPKVMDALRDVAQRRGRSRHHAAESSSIIRRHWLAQYFAAPPLPTVVDAPTGEPLLLITDHYRVKDWAALEQSLTRQPDVDGGRASGWSRLARGEDGQTRPTASINPANNEDRISVFYKTQSYADKGRPWFERLAGTAVQFISRELSDPKGVMAKLSADDERRPSRHPPDLPPEVMAEVIEKALRQTYANWADEPIPALGGKTPRRAMRSPGGLERVKGLLRTYEAGEKRQALQQGRRAISFAFLWKSLGIDP